MDQHLHKVFPLHVHELRDREGPVEGQLHHVVPPHLPRDLVVRVVVPDIITVTQFNPLINIAPRRLSYYLITEFDLTYIPTHVVPWRVLKINR